MCVCVYIEMCVCMCVCEREREREAIMDKPPDGSESFAGVCSWRLQCAVTCMNAYASVVCA